MDADVAAKLTAIARDALATRPRGADPRGIALAVGLRMICLPTSGRAATTSDRIAWVYDPDPARERSAILDELARALLLRAGEVADAERFGHLRAALGD